MDRVNISERPQEANARTELYHFEGDTVVGKDHKGAILTMVDRVSRYTILAKSEDRTASSIKELLCKASNGNKILTATFDNGKEFAKHKELKLETGIDVYFGSVQKSVSIAFRFYPLIYPLLPKKQLQDIFYS